MHLGLLVGISIGSLDGDDLPLQSIENPGMRYGCQAVSVVSLTLTARSLRARGPLLHWHGTEGNLHTQLDNYGYLSQPRGESSAAAATATTRCCCPAKPESDAEGLLRRYGLRHHLCNLPA